ncbi:MAG: N-acetylneuraminate synthase [Nanoarchaeota archaeon]|nr:N-acetylneuraminate synthase [Nanoarchaeota archaeon]
MNKIIKIKNYKIGEDYPCFIIVEVGPNHNGDIDIAKKLIDVASEAGVDAIKFQTFKSEKYVSKGTPKAKYDIRNTGTNEEMLKEQRKFELSKETHIKLKDYTENKGLIFFSTPHANEWSIDLLEEIGVPAYKIGSGDITNIQIIKYIASKNKPIILSTGMSTMEEIKRAVDTIKETENKDLIILHCTSDYPCDIKDVNLNVIPILKNKFNTIVGYSDHTLRIDVPSLAVALGAKVIEKHITLDRKLPGPDHKSSLEPQELKEMVKRIREIEIILGSKEKIPTEAELDVAKIARKSLVSDRKIKKGEIITQDMITYKRPGTGIPPYEINKVLGKKAKRDIKKDELISFKDIY